MIAKPRRIRNHKAIQAARKDYCERCGRRDLPIEVHHVLHRQMGGGRQLDVPENLLALCVACHRAYYNGRIGREELMEIARRRSS